MKDATHHLKGLQRKVIQANRKANNEKAEIPPSNVDSITESKSKGKFDLNRRVPKKLKRQPLL